jgi:hypothetical protein
LIGLYFVFGRFWYDAARRSRAYYGVSDQHIVIVSGWTNRKVNSLNLATLTEITLYRAKQRWWRYRIRSRFTHAPVVRCHGVAASRNPCPSTF